MNLWSGYKGASRGSVELSLTKVSFSLEILDDKIMDIVFIQNIRTPNSSPYTSNTIQKSVLLRVNTFKLLDESTNRVDPDKTSRSAMSDLFYTVCLDLSV